MLPSEAHRIAIGSPRSWMLSSWSRIIRRRIPWRRCVGWTPTIVTPAAGTTPPGIVSSKLKMPAVPTIRSPSYAAMARSASKASLQFARSSSRGISLKATSAGLVEVPRVAAEGADVDIHAPIMAWSLLYPSADVPDRRRERAWPRACLRHAGHHRPEHPRLPPAPGSGSQPGGGGVHVRLQRRSVRDRQRRRPGRPAADHRRRRDRSRCHRNPGRTRSG